MKYVHIVAEGPTEVDFVKTILSVHLNSFNDSLHVQASDVGGRCTYATLRRHVRKLLQRQSPDLLVSTLIDFYACPGDLPGREHNAPVTEIEGRWAEDIKDQRFLPHLQLHEFEAMLLSDLRKLVRLYPGSSANIEKLAKSLDHAEPEQVNGLTPPSHRIRQAVPEYSKRLGVTVLQQIGLQMIRERCPHFGGWLRRLEDFAGAK